MANIINGTLYATQIKDELRDEVSLLNNQGISITLAVIQVGKDPASSVYVANKKKACQYVGIHSLSYELPEHTEEKELLTLINDLNNDRSVNGILVQLPLPGHIHADSVIKAIAAEKDVDGFHPMNVGALWQDQSRFLPCTPAGIIELLKRSHIPLEGKKCVIIGRSNIVGKPMAALLLRENATVTIAHSRTTQLAALCKTADILIVAVGRSKFVTAEFVKQGSVVIDVGIHRDEKGKLHGDVDFEDVIDIVGAITPVPGGVGPMTIAMLMNNCVETVRKH